MELYLVRHGETEWSRARRHTGRSDLPLSPAGEAEALALDAALLRLLAVGGRLVGPRDLAALGRRARSLRRPDVPLPDDPVDRVVLGVDESQVGSLVDALDDLPAGDPDPLSGEGRRRLETLRDELLPATIGTVDGATYAVTGGTAPVPGYGEIDLGELGTLEPGEEAKVTGIAIDAAGPFDTATINFRDADMMIDGSYAPVDSASASELIVWTE